MNLKNKKLFIFDLDGTLVDTAPDFKNSLNYMLSELNEPLVTLEEIRNLVGYGARELIRRTVVTKNIPHDDNKINEMLKIFLLHYTHNIDDDSVLFENVETVLKRDSATDLNAGHNANMPVVLVGYGYTDNKNIYNDADLVINNFSQLTELIE